MDKQREIWEKASFLILYPCKITKTKTDAKQKQTDYKVMKAEKTLPDIRQGNTDTYKIKSVLQKSELLPVK